jgi:AraC-like DNA-binding protein
MRKFIARHFHSETAMPHFFDQYLFIVFFAGILGFMVSIILVFVNKTDTFQSRLLAGFLTCFSILAVVYALMVSDYYLSHPHQWRIFSWASFSFAPFAYLYVRSVLQQSYRFKKLDFLLFLPALIHPLSLIPFFIQPEAEKIAFLKQVYSNRKLISLEPESLLPNGSGIVMRLALGVFCVVGQYRLLYKWRKRNPQAFQQVSQNASTFRWLFLFTSVMALFFGIVILEFMLQATQPADFNYAVIFTITGTIFFVALYLLVKPSILYGLKGWRDGSKGPEVAATNITLQETVDEPSIKSVGKHHYISSEQGHAIKKSLEDHLRENQPFRRRGYTVADLARELQLPSYLVSAFINQQYGKNFNELINDYRVDFLLEKSKLSDDFESLTLEAIGREAGFNSRAAFIAAVKRKTGKNPSEIFGRRGEKIA